jgi:hypothetical protein
MIVALISWKAIKRQTCRRCSMRQARQYQWLTERLTAGSLNCLDGMEAWLGALGFATLTLSCIATTILLRAYCSAGLDRIPQRCASSVQLQRSNVAEGGAALAHGLKDSFLLRRPIGGGQGA